MRAEVQNSRTLQSRMRRLLLGLMAANLSGIEANRLLSEFYLVDSDGSGTIELNELVEAAKQVGILPQQ